MSTRDEQRAEAVERLAAHLLRTGLAESSLRQLATAAGVSDRMLLYYFSDKSEVLAAALARIAGDLALELAKAIPADAALTAQRLAVVAAGMTTAPPMRPYMRLWIQVVAAAARREAPFVDIAQQITDGFLAWIEARLAPEAVVDPTARRAVAGAVLAVIDGFALLEICAGADVADAAGGALGGLFATNPDRSVVK